MTRHILLSPPLACILGLSRQYLTCTPPVSHRILGINQSKVLTKPHTGQGEATSQHHHTGGKPCSILGIPRAYPCIDLYLQPFCSRSIVVSRCIPLHPAVTARRTYLITVSSCICCIPMYLTVSHRLKNAGCNQKYTPGPGSRGGLSSFLLVRHTPCSGACCPPPTPPTV